MKESQYIAQPMATLLTSYVSQVFNFNLVMSYISQEFNLNYIISKNASVSKVFIINYVICNIT